MSKPVYVVCALLVFLFTFAAQAPAWLFAEIVRALTQSRFVVSSPAGTFWHGKGDLSQVSNRGPLAILPGMRWEIERLPLLTANARGRLGRGDTASGTAEFEINAREQRWRAVYLILPASTLSAVASLPQHLRFGGEVIIRSSDFSWAPQSVNGQIQAIWQNATLLLQAPASPMDLGNVVVDIVGIGTTFKLKLINQGGIIELRGDGEWPSRGHLHAKLLTKPTAATPPELVQWLKQIGQLQADGSYLIDYAAK